VVLTSLPDSDVFETVARETFVPLARAGQVFVDLGTWLRPAREIAARGRKAFLSAAVSGDPRTPVYMFAGGDAAAFERVRPLLETLADPAHLILAGPSGAGQILKGVNQLSMGVVRAAWLEAVSYATRQGIDAATVAAAVGGDAGWRRELADTARLIAEGKAEGQDAKFASCPISFTPELAGADLR
jgi:3-hydroxyisobutyrate dehydrogenase-like beta-hydroxyacid dehydrogenase